MMAARSSANRLSSFRVQMKKAVICGRDGILLDTTGIHIQAVVTAFEETADITLDKTDIAKIPGRGPDVYYRELEKRYFFEAQPVRERQRKVYYALLKDASLMPGAAEFLAYVQEQGYLTGLTTGANRRSTDEMIERNRMHGIFDVIVTAEDCTHKKPDPEPYLITASRLEIRPEHCTVIEDSQTGVLSTKSAGSICIAVPTVYTANQDFSMADHVVSSLTEIIGRALV